MTAVERRTTKRRCLVLVEMGLLRNADPEVQNRARVYFAVQLQRGQGPRTVEAAKWVTLRSIPVDAGPRTQNELGPFTDGSNCCKLVEPRGIEPMTS
jgi:hypothetical protein